MQTYYFKSRQDQRVYLCPIPPTKEESLIDTIVADNWQDARAQINAEFYEHRPGYGRYE